MNEDFDWQAFIDNLWQRENAASMTPEQWTAAQDAAIARGDWEEAQRLNDLHAVIAKKDNPVKGEVFAHSGNEDFTVFDEAHFGETDEGYHGKGFYFSNTRIPEDPSVFKRMTFGPHGEIPTMNYGPNKKSYYLYVDRVVPGGNPETNFFGTDDIAIVSQRNFENGKPTEIIIGKPNHIKSADAVTYDDNGIRIPLGDRHNLNVDDTTVHEELHHTTNNSEGHPLNTPDPDRNNYDKFMEPVTITDNEGNTVILPTKRYQNYMMDQNENLLPTRDPIYTLSMDYPESAKEEFIRQGFTPEAAEVEVKRRRLEVGDLWSIQEQRSYLKSWFNKYIRPHLKNKRDATEIEPYINEHKSLINKDRDVRLIMTKLRPGSIKDYAKYFAESLATLPIVNSVISNNQNQDQ